MTGLTYLLTQIDHEIGSATSTARVMAGVDKDGRPHVTATISDEHDLYPPRGRYGSRIWTLRSQFDLAGTDSKIITITGDEDSDHADLAQQLLDVLAAPRIAVD